MNHPTPSHAAAIAAVLAAGLALAVLLAPANEGLHARPATHADASVRVAVGSTLPSQYPQYPAPQGEAEELPAQF